MMYRALLCIMAIQSVAMRPQVIAWWGAHVTKGGLLGFGLLLSITATLGAALIATRRK